MSALSDAVRIGSVRTKNRICIPPMVRFGYAGADGMVTQEHLRHYKALAAGGAGLIIQEATCVSPGGRLSMDQLGIWSDQHIPGLREITELVLRETGVDMVDVGRSALVDPHWPKKALAGKTPGKCLHCADCQWRRAPEKCPGRILMNREAGK